VHLARWSSAAGVSGAVGSNACPFLPTTEYSKPGVMQAVMPSISNRQASAYSLDRLSERMSHITPPLAVEEHSDSQMMTGYSLQENQTARHPSIGVFTGDRLQNERPRLAARRRQDALKRRQVNRARLVLGTGEPGVNFLDLARLAVAQPTVRMPPRGLRSNHCQRGRRTPF
jgi:hypothetical protein